VGDSAWDGATAEKKAAAWASARLQRWLFRFVGFEKGSRLFEVKGGAVDGQLIFACVVRDADDVLDAMATLAEGLYEKVDIYHGGKFTAVECFWAGK
jgi:hypothetical protein